MKIKASSDLSLSFLPAIMIIVTAMAALSRSFQVFTLIDASTGFYKEKSMITLVFYSIIAVSVVIFCVLPYLSHKSEGITMYAIENKRLSVITALFGVTLIFDALSSLFGSAANNSQIEYVDEEAIKEIIGSGTITGLARGIFALLSAIYLLTLASSMRNGSDKASKQKILALAPIVWSASRLVGLFVTKISFLKVSDLFLELAMLSFMTVFFLSLAQTTSGVYSDGAGWKITAFGLSSALIAGTLSFSRLIATLINKQLYISSEHPFEITDFVFFFFALMLVYEVTREYNLIFKEEAEETEEEQELFD